MIYSKKYFIQPKTDTDSLVEKDSSLNNSIGKITNTIFETDKCYSKTKLKSNSVYKFRFDYSKKRPFSLITKSKFINPCTDLVIIEEENYRNKLDKYNMTKIPLVINEDAIREVYDFKKISKHFFNLDQSYGNKTLNNYSGNRVKGNITCRNSKSSNLNIGKSFYFMNNHKNTSNLTKMPAKNISYLRNNSLNIKNINDNKATSYSCRSEKIKNFNNATSTTGDISKQNESQKRFCLKTCKNSKRMINSAYNIKKKLNINQKFLIENLTINKDSNTNRNDHPSLTILNEDILNKSISYQEQDSEISISTFYKKEINNDDNEENTNLMVIEEKNNDERCKEIELKDTESVNTIHTISNNKYDKGNEESSKEINIKNNLKRLDTISTFQEFEIKDNFINTNTNSNIFMNTITPQKQTYVRLKGLAEFYNIKPKKPSKDFYDRFISHAESIIKFPKTSKYTNIRNQSGEVNYNITAYDRSNKKSFNNNSNISLSTIKSSKSKTKIRNSNNNINNKRSIESVASVTSIASKTSKISNKSANNTNNMNKLNTPQYPNTTKNTNKQKSVFNNSITKNFNKTKIIKHKNLTKFLSSNQIQFKNIIKNNSTSLGYKKNEKDNASNAFHLRNSHFINKDNNNDYTNYKCNDSFVNLTNQTIVTTIPNSSIEIIEELNPDFGIIETTNNTDTCNKRESLKKKKSQSRYTDNKYKDLNIAFNQNKDIIIQRKRELEQRIQSMLYNYNNKSNSLTKSCKDINHTINNTNNSNSSIKRNNENRRDNNILIKDSWNPVLLTNSNSINTNELFSQSSSRFNINTNNKKQTTKSSMSNKEQELNLKRNKASSLVKAKQYDIKLKFKKNSSVDGLSANRLIKHCNKSNVNKSNINNKKKIVETTNNLNNNTNINISKTNMNKFNINSSFNNKKDIITNISNVGVNVIQNYNNDPVILDVLNSIKKINNEVKQTSDSTNKKIIINEEVNTSLHEMINTTEEQQVNNSCNKKEERSSSYNSGNISTINEVINNITLIPYNDSISSESFKFNTKDFSICKINDTKKTSLMTMLNSKSSVYTKKHIRNNTHMIIKPQFRDKNDTVKNISFSKDYNKCNNTIDNKEMKNSCLNLNFKINLIPCFIDNNKKDLNSNINQVFNITNNFNINRNSATYNSLNEHLLQANINNETEKVKRSSTFNNLKVKLNL